MNQNLEKNHIVLTWKIKILPGHNFVHATATKLSRCMQNYDLSHFIYHKKYRQIIFKRFQLHAHKSFVKWVPGHDLHPEGRIIRLRLLMVWCHGISVAIGWQEEIICLLRDNLWLLHIDRSWPRGEGTGSMLRPSCQMQGIPIIKITQFHRLLGVLGVDKMAAILQTFLNAFSFFEWKLANFKWNFIVICLSGSA